MSPSLAGRSGNSSGLGSGPDSELPPSACQAQEMAQALLSQRSPGLVGTGGRGQVERVAAPAISDQMMGGPALDATGSALRPAMIHSDTRAEPQSQALAAVLPEAE